MISKEAIGLFFNLLLKLSLAASFALLAGCISESKDLTPIPVVHTPPTVTADASNTPILAPSANFAIYNDFGVWSESVTAFERFLDSLHIRHSRIKAIDINENRFDGFTGLFVPGGWSPLYNARIKAAGIENIRAFVRAGGDYVGICAGAWFAAASIEYLGTRFGSNASLFEGRLKLVEWTAIGPINEIAVYPDYAMTDIDVDPLSALSDPFPERNTLYFGGPWFRVKDGAQEIDVIATYRNNNKPAVIATRFGAGQVLLSGVHLEIDTPGVSQSSGPIGPVDPRRGKVLRDTDGSEWPFFTVLLTSGSK